ncbi:MAG: glycosyltransferase family 4 protein [Halioglobus sp.]
MIAVLFTLLISVILCGAYLRLARHWQLLDEPNSRSSHLAPTPHGGGVALMLAFMLGLLLANRLYGGWSGAVTTLSISALILTGLGILDDLRGLSVRLRLLTYAIVCLWVASALLPETGAEHAIGWVLLVCVIAIAMLWVVNLYNFMDGIDGIAAMQTILACCGAALIAFIWEQETGYALFCLLLAAAHGGFLVWNYPPARLFMGDAGSVPTGILLAGLALLGAVEGQINPLCWLVLLAGFITDASLTLIWRIGTGQAFMQPHRQHAYQRLSRYWKSHSKVDAWFVVINVLWLLPLACAVQAWPKINLFLVLLAYLPLVFGMVKTARLS